VLNATVTTPKTWNSFARDFLFGIITTIQSPMRFTKFAGFDANGDIFGNNDRVGIEPRNTFIAIISVPWTCASLASLIFRRNAASNSSPKHSTSRTPLNVRYFNTVYGAADFCRFSAGTGGCTATPSAFPEVRRISTMGHRGL